MTYDPQSRTSGLINGNGEYDRSTKWPMVSPSEHSRLQERKVISTGIDELVKKGSLQAPTSTHEALPQDWLSKAKRGAGVVSGQPSPRPLWFKESTANIESESSLIELPHSVSIDLSRTISLSLSLSL